MYDVIVIGGGAAGFYGAINLAEFRPDLNIVILEQGKQVLGKVRVSGGGRCNVTHAQFNPRILAKQYPRGEKELVGPFNTHNSEHTVQFFQKRGIDLKIEDDGRMFPVSNSSQTIIDCFMEAIANSKIELKRNTVVTDILVTSSDSDNREVYEVRTKTTSYFTNQILITTGSSPKMWSVLQKLGHTIIEPVPSLFTFNIRDTRIEGIPGLSTHARVKLISRDIPGKKITVSLRSTADRSEELVSEGPLLITHWGMSGPAILKLSAWGARIFHDYQYRFKIQLNWVPEYHQQGLFSFLMEVKDIEAKKTVSRTHPLDIPKRLWGKLVQASGILQDQKWADVSKKQLQELARELTAGEFLVDGKSTFKEEFVTAGGIDLKEVNFKSFESKLHPGIYFAGEILNIDAITGGYNFQNAWTGSYMAAQAIANT